MRVGEGVEQFCGWCAMYATRSDWSERCKEEILHVGRHCQMVAVQCRKTPPEIDERGRLGSGDAERFMVGVRLSTILSRRLIGGRDLESARS